MAKEISLQAALAFLDSLGQSAEQPLLQLQIDSSTDKFVKGSLSVTTSEIAIPLGGMTQLGWAAFVNRDPTNYLELRVATSGSKFAKLLPGEPALVRLGSDAQAPYAIANSAPCKMEYLICGT